MSLQEEYDRITQDVAEFRRSRGEKLYRVQYLCDCPTAHQCAMVCWSLSSRSLLDTLAEHSWVTQVVSVEEI